MLTRLINAARCRWRGRWKVTSPRWGYNNNKININISICLQRQSQHLMQPFQIDYAHTNLAVNLLVPSFKSIYTSTNHVLDTLDIFLKQVQKVTFWNLIYSVPVLKEVDSLFCSIWGSYKDLKWQVISDIFLANNFFLLKGHIMSHSDTILVGQKKILVGHHQKRLPGTVHVHAIN